MYAPAMTFVIRSEAGDVIATRDTYEDARRVALWNTPQNPVIEDKDGNELARATFTPAESGRDA